ncbi:MAG: hypothetical protein Q8K75_12955 [Chlamydiales bacterium]|nr:hypothetical protein [Chlamydiales bacterium]
MDNFIDPNILNGLRSEFFIDLVKPIGPKAAWAVVTTLAINALSEAVQGFPRNDWLVMTGAQAFLGATATAFIQVMSIIHPIGFLDSLVLSDHQKSLVTSTIYTLGVVGMVLLNSSHTTFSNALLGLTPVLAGIFTAAANYNKFHDRAHCVNTFVSTVLVGAVIVNYGSRLVH